MLTRIIPLLLVVGLLLVTCDGGETPVVTPAQPAATLEATSTAVVPPPVVESTATAVASRPARTAVPVTTPDLLEDLEAIDTVLQEIDNQVCQEALETRAEIEALLEQGQDVSDLAAAIDELIAELEGCSIMPTPTP